MIYAGIDKASLRYNEDINPRDNHILCGLIVSEANYVDIEMEIVHKENFIREVAINNFWDERGGTRREEYIPQLRGKNIMALGKISNKHGLMQPQNYWVCLWNEHEGGTGGAGSKKHLSERKGHRRRMSN